MNLHLYRSHRLESLAAALAALLRDPLHSPLQAEIIVVQSLGMRRWLSLQLAEALGVTMNARFPFPADFAQQVFRAAFPGEVDEQAFDRELLPWRVLAQLPKIIAAEDASDLRHYLESDNAPLKAWQLAQRVAAMFDRYLAYRPELLLKWQDARGSKEWQVQLWRELTCGGKAAAHAPALQQRLDNLVKEGRTKTLTGALPERVVVFGISSLPPLYLHLLETVSKCVNVHLFLLEPTREFTGELVSQREIDRELLRLDGGPEPEHFDIGNPLFSSLGRAGREFARLVVDLEPIAEPDHFGAEPTRRDSLLHHVQADIFEMRNPSVREDDSSEVAAPIPIAPDDLSIRVQCCHSAMREVEVLHDQLLELFEREPSLTPRDILVSVPDIESYAPFIEAVFGSPEHPRSAIPFTVADRNGRAESGVADAFLRLLDLHGGRFTAPAVLGVLDCAAIRARYELRDGDLDVVREWVAECGIRWGIDETHRDELGLPAVRDNSWRAGLDRLLLGYALPGDERTLFDGILPYREIEGSLATTLGQFADFAENLFAKIPALSGPRTLVQWQLTFRDLLHTFFADSDEYADELRRLREVVTRLESIAQGADFTEAVSFDVIRAYLDTAIADSQSGLGFLNGAVTFCALKPMRAIPFRVICLLGMNGKAFPRRDPGLAFDRMLREPRRGDRSQRDEDRYVFLEALLSARDVLHLSYTGRSVRDNSEAPPSVVVSELLDYLCAHYTSQSGKLRAQLVTEQKLQPFSTAYSTGDSRYFSYSAENARTRTSDATSELRPFSATPLPPPGPEWFDVDLEQLCSFFAHPSRYFCQKRLRMTAPEEFAPLEESEPTELDSLTRYALGQELTEAAIAGSAPRAHLPAIRARGILPYGYTGDAEFAELDSDASLLAARIRATVKGQQLPPASLHVTLGDWSLTGTLHGISPDAHVRYRNAKLKGKDLLHAWVRHLALQLIDTAPRITFLFARDATWRFRPVENAHALLAHLLDLYRGGMQAPLPLFSETSQEFAQRTLRPNPRAKSDPMTAARSRWVGSDQAPGERDDIWLRLCFPPEPNPLDAKWQEIALYVFDPLFAASEEVSS